jgi:hypothetical protein
MRWKKSDPGSCPSNIHNFIIALSHHHMAPINPRNKKGFLDPDLLNLNPDSDLDRETCQKVDLIILNSPF